MKLTLNELDDAGIRLAYGLTAVRAKDGGGKLLAVLADIFKTEYEGRTGKLPSASIHIDFEVYSPDELTYAFGHFSSLAAAFLSTGNKSSSDFCLMIIGSILSALDSHRGAGHA